MKPRTLKIIYWVLISLFSLGISFGAVTEIMRTEMNKELFVHLGYPAYVLTIIGIAKLIGIISILQPRFKTLREWAYAGFSIDLIGAAASHAFVGDGFGIMISPLIGLVFMFTTYFLGKKIGR